LVVEPANRCPMTRAPTGSLSRFAEISQFRVRSSRTIERRSSMVMREPEGRASSCRLPSFNGCAPPWIGPL
jgi:hypothetical protein